MQKAAGNQKVAQYLQSRVPIQRTPDSFSTWRSEELPPDRKTWGTICKLVADYSKLSADSPAREQLLLSLNTNIAGWFREYMAISPQLKRQEIEMWGMRSSAIHDLMRRIKVEWQEMNGFGELSSMLEPRMYLNPELTNKAPESPSEKVSGGVFLTNARIVDGMSNTIGVAKKGFMCEYLVDDPGTDHIDKNAYYKVRTNQMIAGSPNYLAIPEGYVERTAVQSINHLKIEPELRYEQVDEDVGAQPLFPHSPKLDDVRQGYIGDCYLLAAVSSLVHNSPAHITKIMRDNGNGTVTVRLYDVQTGSGQSKLFTPREITIEKSVVKRVNPTTKRDEFAQGTLWVQLLEKAYVAAGYHGGSEDRLDIQKSTFGQFAGGQAAYAFEHLTGRAAERLNISTYDEKTEGGKWTFINELVGELLNHKQESFDEWVNKLGTAQPELTKLHEKSRHVHLSEIESFLKSQKLSAEVHKIVMDFLTRKQMYGGKRGTGKYTKTQDDTFELIRKSMDAGKAVTASTHEKIATPKAKGLFGLGHSGGEQMAKGLAGNHEYSVIGYRVVGDLKEVKLRNPWGHYGRAYTKHWLSSATSAKETPSGEFWLDLSDLTKRFSAIQMVDLNEYALVPYQ